MLFYLTLSSQAPHTTTVSYTNRNSNSTTQIIRTKTSKSIAPYLFAEAAMSQPPFTGRPLRVSQFPGVPPFLQAVVGPGGTLQPPPTQLRLGNKSTSNHRKYKEIQARGCAIAYPGSSCGGWSSQSPDSWSPPLAWRRGRTGGRGSLMPGTGSRSPLLTMTTGRQD